MSNKPISWCCRGFEHMFGRGGERGFAVLVKPGPEGAAMFILQHRALDAHLSLPALSSDVPVEVMSELVIVHCPWCGRALDRAYRDVPPLLRPGLLIPD